MIDDLLAEILANPRHIALRLVYADQLLERGDPRGELIQLECTPGPMTPERRARRDELANQFVAAWKTETNLDVKLDRGFVSLVRGTTDDVVAHAARIAREPVRELRVSPRGDLTAFASLPELAPIEKLRFSGVLKDAALDALAGSTTLTSLRALSLATDRSFDGAVWAPKLEHLELYWVGDRNTTRDLLRDFGGLTSIDLLMFPLGVQVAELARRLPQLQSLKIRHGQLGHNGARVLSGVPLPHLSNLEVAYDTIGDAGARAIAEANGWPALRRLALPSDNISDLGCAAIVASTVAAHLRELELSQNDLTEASVHAIAKATNLRLRTLGLWSRSISGEALQVLMTKRPGLRVIGMRPPERAPT